MKPMALALALSLAAAPAIASEPVDLAQGQAAPYAGTLTEPEAWKVAAAKRMDLEQELSALKAAPCQDGSPRITTGLVIAGALFAAGLVLGVLVTR